VKPDTAAIFFEAPADLRAWLEANHTTETELWVGSYRKSAGVAALTWPQIVDELLCFGWIDGVRYGLDEQRWAIRVTPRKKGSNWSAVNVRRVGELEQQGRMTDAGRRAFAARDTEREGYSYERSEMHLTPAFERRFHANGVAWAWFSGQAPSYQRTAVYWVMSAKREETRERRLETLIEDSAAGTFIKPLSYGRSGRSQKGA
jgi:uncharacterized protein YdeI (YjbR/CyaY-like superfamily)